MPTPEIKPCLYCGSKMLVGGDTFHTKIKHWWLYCDNDDCDARSMDRPTQEAAIAAHNAAWERREGSNHGEP